MFIGSHPVRFYGRRQALSNLFTEREHDGIEGLQVQRSDDLLQAVDL